MDLVGYSDRLSVKPGEAVSFMVSAAKGETYRASLVRLICGDDNPEGPGFKEEEIGGLIAGEYPGRTQLLRPGSFVLIPPSDKLGLSFGFTLAAWIFPTTPALGRSQGLISRWSPKTRHGYSLFLDDVGRLSLRVGDGAGQADAIASVLPLQGKTWYFVAGSFDAASATLTVRYHRRDTWGDESDRQSQSKSTHFVEATSPAEPLLMAAEWLEALNLRKATPVGPYNGKIDSPVIFKKAADDEEFAQLMTSPSGKRMAEHLIAAWDFAAEMSSLSVLETSRNRLHGSLINMPTRASTGHLWTGSSTSWREAPEHYSAIHFHEDDLEDAGWEVDFQLDVPKEMRSGVYAVKLTASDAEDYVPFVVRPRAEPTAATLFLVPTFSYLAYANEHKAWLHPDRAVTLGVPNIGQYVQLQDRYMLDQRLLSLYEKHSDDSGVVYSSALRPLLTVRPKYDKPLMRAPHEFNSDLYIVDWLEHQGHAYDVATDGDLHRDGAELLKPYRVVLTGTHPEYWTTSMMDGLSSYLAEGGRLMYLGGNGFYWVTSVHPERPHVIEVRRGHSGTRPSASEPGECYHSTTGEFGGLWRNRGRVPQSLVGVGTTGLGADKSLPYRRQEASFDKRVEFIFKGVDSDALIGDQGRLLGGAGGFEIDRLDYALGTPPHAVLLATATGFSDHYLGSVEEALESDAVKSGADNPNVRADMVYFEGPKGGAVFSVGSMAWAAALFCNSYDNPVSRITDNVLKAFATRP